MPILLYGIPIVIGFMLGWFLALPINIAISIDVDAIAFAAYAVWTTRNAEIGSLIGVIVAYEVGLGIVSLWVTILAVGGLPFHIDVSWLLRAHA